MRKTSAITALLLFFTVSFAQKTDKRFAGLDTTLNRVLKDWKAAGFAVAVIEKDKIIYTKGFGFRDIEKKLPVTSNTLFAIGSCTKAFTSSLIGLLQKEDKIEYDKPVRTYLPELKFYNDAMDNLITVRDMMCHRTGLPRHDFSWYMFPTTRDSLIYRIRFLEPTASVREKWQYNNFMFTAQGVVAEKLFGKKWERLIKEKIFDSLDMKSSDFSVEDMVKNNDAATGYYVKKDSIIEKMDYYNIDAMGPAGSINSSVNEMANWVIAWINGGKYKGREVLPPQYIAEAISSQMVSAGGVPDKENPDIHFSTYGFGWSMASYRGHYRVQHGGNIDGFSAMTCFFPSDSIGIVVLTNQNGSVLPGIVRNIVADRMLNISRKDWNGIQLKADAKAKKEAKETEKSKTASEKKYAPQTHTAKDYEGLYSNPGYGIIDITAKGDSLFIYTKNANYWLKHSTYDVFNLYGVDKKSGIDTTGGSGMAIQFVINKMGEIEALETELEYGLKPFVFKRSPKPVAVEGVSLKKYEGEYELGGMVAKVYIKNENVLYVFVPGQPEYETVPAGNGEFKLKSLSGYSMKFVVDEKGKVIAANFIQPNGTFKAIKK